MKRMNLRGLALIAAAGSMLAFELVAMRGVFPIASQAIAATSIARAERALASTSMPIATSEVAIAGRRIAWNDRRMGIVVVKRVDARRSTCSVQKITRTVAESLVSTLHEAVL